jgi:DNA-binding NarL/FixJ family response regulator
MSAERSCMIIDAHPVVRLGIRRLLEPAEWDFEELPHGGEAVSLINSVGRFDVAIVEMRAAQGDAPSGTQTVRALLKAQPGIGIVAHGGRVGRHSLREALDAGASAYVSKRSSPTVLRTAVNAVERFDSFIDPEAAEAAGRAIAITPRQRQVLQLFANGLSTDEAAEQLGLSRETVRTHARATLPRLGARDRAHAIAIALRGSLID